MSSNLLEVRRQVDELSHSVDEAAHSINKYTALISGAARLARMMGLPENVEAQIRTIQRLIQIVNGLRAAYLALQAARMAGGDPLAWAAAIISVSGFGASVMMEMNSG